METEFRIIEANGLQHRVALAGPAYGPLILMVHGFPESWYSWRHQLKALGEAGYRVAAPDVRGYGGTDKPHEIEAYAIEALASDASEIAAALSPDKPAVIVGHDWGAPIAWTSALVHPERFRAVCGMSVPHVPPGPVAGLELFRKVFTDHGRFFYIVYFQDEGVAEAELEADPAASIRKFYYAISGDAPEGTWPLDKKHGETLLARLPEPPMPLGWLSEADVDYYAGQFAASGFRGPLNRYRNSHTDHEYLGRLYSHVIHQPSLFIGGTKDPVLSFYPGDPIEAMRPHLPALDAAHILEGCGHWTQQERPDEVNALLLDWLGRL